MGVKLNLNLDGNSLEKPVTVFHSVHYKGNRFRISSGQAIERKHWDTENQKVKRTRANYDQFNAIFQQQANDIERVVLRLEKVDHPVTKETVVSQLPWSNSVEVHDYKPIPLFEKFINSHGSDKAERTIKGYRTTLKYLTGYSDQLGRPLNFVDFDIDFYKRFRDYLGMYDNSFGFYVKNLKTFLNWAKEKGFHSVAQYLKWKVPNEDGKDHFFLKYDEILQLASLDLDTRLANVRDLFLMGCYCGLRYSDLVTLKPVHVQNGFITKVAMKTNEPIKIPIIPELQDLFNKYWDKGDSLPQISNQKGNEYLKELAKKAKLKRKFNYIQKRNKQAKEETFEAWEMMSWHVARHSFITNCIQLGVPTEVVRRVVGHSSFQTLKKYIQNDDDFNRSEIMKLSRSRGTNRKNKR
jgi:integrase